MTQEYWKWPESRWTSKDIDWKRANTITAGVDVGAVSSQAVVMCDGELYCYANIHTVPERGAGATRAIETAMEGTGLKLDNIQNTVGTGYRRKSIPFAQKTVNEVMCHAKGARYLCGPTVKTVVDLGGQTSKAIKLYEWDRVADFTVNDKCAIGMGRGIELVADLMHIPIEEMGERSLAVKEDPEPVSTTCYVFANTEALGLLREGRSESEVLASYLFAVAYRLYPFVGRISPEKDLALTGGLAKNVGVVRRLERELGITALTPRYDPQIAGAAGAALLARTLAEKPGRPVAARA